LPDTLTCGKPKPSGYPLTVRTLGDRLKRRRLDLGLQRNEVAFRLKVDPTTVRNWEEGRTLPAVRHYPAIGAFLGTNRLPEPTTPAEALRYARVERGLSLRAMARELGVDPDTLSRWEAGLGCPDRFRDLLRRPRNERTARPDPVC
jgi:transcriptional regulator with XRE-family HTH domain